jgi:hypothetical protein
VQTEGVFSECACTSVCMCMCVHETKSVSGSRKGALPAPSPQVHSAGVDTIPEKPLCSGSL